MFRVNCDPLRPTQVEGKDLPRLYTVSRDGAVFSWRFAPKPKGGSKLPKTGDEEDEEEEEEEEEEKDTPLQDPSDFPFLARGTWSLSEKHYLHQRGSKVRGSKVRGSKVRGSKVRGSKVRGCANTRVEREGWSDTDDTAQCRSAYRHGYV